VHIENNTPNPTAHPIAPPAKLKITTCKKETDGLNVGIHSIIAIVPAIHHAGKYPETMNDVVDFVCEVSVAFIVYFLYLCCSYDHIPYTCTLNNDTIGPERVLLI